LPRLKLGILRSDRRLQVTDVNRPAVEQRSAVDGVTVDGDRLSNGPGGRYRPVMRDVSKVIIVNEKDQGVMGVAEACCRLRYGVQDGLDAG
jgi:hypothetical protein